MEGEKYVIVLAGMIGAGKTTYTKYISEYFNSEAFYESVDDNPILEKFYKDKSRWGFALQVHFLNTRFKSIKRALQHKNNVLDRSIYEDSLFTQINFEQGNITKKEMDIYNSLLDNMMEEIDGMPKKSPDLLIYLRGTFEKHLEHITKRGRDFEQSPEQLEYFRHLHSKYDEWFNNYKASDTLVFSIDELSIEDKDDREYILKTIENKLKEIRQ
ncbi:hypothetical protein HMPREF9709_01041 [Helcococcus kunzii ATCC 51366]|uniref:Deoxynucleoside kinase domain-containing protein n=1 Tax=Helcococcus kunzii ATCC 51366 TaxID=883114 RepID=H3NNY0_9FIRM|nr:deoxynucleoside kinase [Helcococcus kunzii]EHR34105.1 hypothetical protein HMPREF9709_01041 [Helcococcus kunzii ATCC 51366]